MYLETNRLIIRDLEPEDTDAYIEMASDGSLGEIFGDCKNCRSWMGDWIEEAKKLCAADNPMKEYLAYAIIDKKKKVPVGSVGCSYYKDLGKVGITYFVGSKYRGNGIAAEAGEAYAEYFLKHYDVPEIIASAKADNIASCKTIEKLGFRLIDTKMYQDVNDAKKELYHFYALSGLKND